MLIDYLPQILIAAGIFALAIEVMVLGFSTFILFFLGLGCFITGLTMQFAWQEANITHAIWSISIITFASALFLWKPLRKMQSQTSTEKNESDFAQITFELTGHVNSTSDDVLYQYSGINWKVRSRTPLSKGQWVKVVDTDVSVLWVEPIKDPSSD
jgi:inner membrane protein